MSKSQLNTFLGVKSFDYLNTDNILGGDCKRKVKDKDKNGEVKEKKKVKLCEQ
jgi:hypothetical protein